MCMRMHVQKQHIFARLPAPLSSGGLQVLVLFCCLPCPALLRGSRDISFATSALLALARTWSFGDVRRTGVGVVKRGRGTVPLLHMQDARIGCQIPRPTAHSAAWGFILGFVPTPDLDGAYGVHHTCCHHETTAVCHTPWAYPRATGWMV